MVIYEIIILYNYNAHFTRCNFLYLINYKMKRFHKSKFCFKYNNLNKAIYVNNLLYHCIYVVIIVIKYRILQIIFRIKNINQKHLLVK